MKLKRLFNVKKKKNAEICAATCKFLKIKQNYLKMLELKKIVGDSKCCE